MAEPPAGPIPDEGFAEDAAYIVERLQQQRNNWVTRATQYARERDDANAEVNDLVEELRVAEATIGKLSARLALAEKVIEHAPRLPPAVSRPRKLIDAEVAYLDALDAYDQASAATTTRGASQ